MNQKTMKEINRHSKKLLVGWLQSLLSEEEAAKINTGNILQFIPDQTHFYANHCLSLSAYSPKWIKKYIKLIKRKNKNINISDISLQDIMSDADAY